MSPPESKQQAWDAHWRTGTLSSLTSEDKTAEAPEAIAAWNEFFRKLPKGAKLLDIATGNGIVPTHAMAFSREYHSEFQVTGIDQANIDPATTVNELKSLLQTITFKGRVDAEDLPFEDATFDAVTGQYAIEYTNIPETIGEIGRVLKPGGHFRFVCHARDGGVVTFNTPKARQCAWLLEKSGVFEALREATGAAFDDAPDREEKRSKFRDNAIKAREQLATMGENPEVQDLLQNLVQVYIARDQFKDYAGFNTWLKGVYDEVSGQIDMILALTDAARTYEGMETLSEDFQREGFEKITVAGLTAGPGGPKLAWQIDGVKA